MIFAHPHEEVALHLRFEEVRLGARLLVQGGLDDRVVVWRRGDVTVEVRVDGESIGTSVVANEPGLQWEVLDTSELAAERAGPVSLELVVTAEDAGQRWLCLDAAVLDVGGDAVGEGESP
jgi:hypothetical protein